MPKAAALAMSGQGAADEAVDHWSSRIARPADVTPALLAAELREYGAWDAGELADDDANWRRILWIAAGNIREASSGGRVRRKRNPKRAHRAANPKGRKAVLDVATRRHLETWLRNNRSHSFIKSRAAIYRALRESPDLIEQGRSWPEIERLGESMPNARRTANPKRRPTAKSPAVKKAVSAFRKWQDRGDVAPRFRRVKKPAPLTHAAAELGELVAVDYKSDKYNGRLTTYTHKFGSPRPSLVTDPDSRSLHIVGGRFKITPDGIVN